MILNMTVECQKNGFLLAKMKMESFNRSLVKVFSKIQQMEVVSGDLFLYTHMMLREKSLLVSGTLVKKNIVN